MEWLKIVNYKYESVVYNKESGDLHLLSTFNAKVLELMLENTSQSNLINKITESYEIEKEDAENYLDNLYTEYRNLNLID